MATVDHDVVVIGAATTAWSPLRTLHGRGCRRCWWRLVIGSEGYRRYVRTAVPAVELIIEAAAEPPTPLGLTRLALRRRLAGSSALLGWSRRSTADVLRAHFESEMVRGPGALTGPMVWGISPEFAGSGLGALTHAMRHAALVGRPVGGSGEVPRTLLASLEAAGGVLRTGTRVTEICCTGERVSGVRLDDGSDDTEIVSASTVVSACNPHDTFLTWLRTPPASARDLVTRWRAIPHADGYESKLDIVVDSVPRLKDDVRDLGPTTVIAPTLAEIHRGWEMMAHGDVLDRPGLLVNVPTLSDPSMAPDGRHVMSIEALTGAATFPGAGVWGASGRNCATVVLTRT